MYRNELCNPENQQRIINQLINSVEVTFGKMISDPDIQEELENLFRKDLVSTGVFDNPNMIDYRNHIAIKETIEEERE